MKTNGRMRDDRLDVDMLGRDMHNEDPRVRVSDRDVAALEAQLFASGVGSVRALEVDPEFHSKPAFVGAATGKRDVLSGMVDTLFAPRLLHTK